ncbi:hypothetical protein DR864_28460 (plasmid) [Runella rosea]|uniref:Uncharacterized protein n=1 Tax=Runella rosea TaxID=2259595 RepID=A0A344TT37_9BACT|nr:hypothetical protein DR864_28460 [Runella rosea]
MFDNISSNWREYQTTYQSHKKYPEFEKHSIDGFTLTGQYYRKLLEFGSTLTDEIVLESLKQYRRFKVKLHLFT